MWQTARYVEVAQIHCASPPGASGEIGGRVVMRIAMIDAAGSLPDPHVAAQLSAGRDLLSTWWPFIFAVLAVLVLIAWAVASRRRGRRAWPHLTGAAVVAIAAVALGVNGWSGYVPSLASSPRLVTDAAVVGTATTGGVTPVTIPVPDALDMPTTTTWIYTPPGYDKASAARYPVMVMIHGSPGQAADWTVGGDLPHTMDVLIGNGLIKPMVVVMPEVNGYGLDQLDTECLDSTTGGPQVETYLSDTLLPWVDAHYATIDSWKARAIGGMSSGAFCAVDQGLRHPQLYGAILSIEGYGDPGEGGHGALATTEEYDAHSPALYVNTMDFVHPVPVFMGVAGESDAGDREANRALADSLQKRGQTVDFEVNEGGYHTWHTARALLPAALIFASEHLEAGPALP